MLLCLTAIILFCSFPREHLQTPRKRKALAKYLYKFMRKHIRKEINNMRNPQQFPVWGSYRIVTVWCKTEYNLRENNWCERKGNGEAWEWCVKKSKRLKTHCPVSLDRFSISKMRSRICFLFLTSSPATIARLEWKRNCWYKAHEMLNFQVVGLSMSRTLGSPLDRQDGSYNCVLVAQSVVHSGNRHLRALGAGPRGRGGRSWGLGLGEGGRGWSGESGKGSRRCTSRWSSWWGEHLSGLGLGARGQNSGKKPCASERHTLASGLRSPAMRPPAGSISGDRKSEPESASSPLVSSSQATSGTAAQNPGSRAVYSPGGLRRAARSRTCPDGPSTLEPKRASGTSVRMKSPRATCSTDVGSGSSTRSTSSRGRCRAQPAGRTSTRVRAPAAVGPVRLPTLGAVSESDSGRARASVRRRLAGPVSSAWFPHRSEEWAPGLRGLLPISSTEGRHFWGLAEGKEALSPARCDAVRASWGAGRRDGGRVLRAPVLPPCGLAVQASRGSPSGAGLSLSPSSLRHLTPISHSTRRPKILQVTPVESSS